MKHKWPALFSISLIFVGAIVVPVPARSEQTERYAVTGVAEDDVLNLRAAPAASAAKISSIPSGATLVLATGRTRNIEGRTWREIGYLGVQGWVNTRYLKPYEPLPAHVPGEPLQCLGTEPHWSMRSQADQSLLLRAPILGKSIALITEPAQASVNHTNRWFLDAVSGDGEQAAAIVIHESESCSDDMSNARYRYAVSVKLHGGVYLSGCCNRIDKP